MTTMQSDRLSGGLRKGVVVISALVPTPLWACAACFGKSDSPMAQGMNMGIFTLLVVVLAVLIGIASFFIYIIRRAARFEAAAAQNHPATVPSMAAPPERAMSQPSQTI